MRVFGYRELHWHYAPDGPSLRESIRGKPHPDQARIAAYLGAGMVLAVRPMVVGDFLKPERQMVSTSHWHTDGNWIWATDVVYYVEEYHAELPDEFVGRMASLGWSCPTLSREQVGQIAEWWVHWLEQTKAEQSDPADRARE